MKDVLASLISPDEIRGSIESKEKEIQALRDLCDTLKFEEGLSLDGLPPKDLLKTLMTNKEKQLEAIGTLLGSLPVSEVTSGESKESDYGSGLFQKLVKPLEQLKVIEKDPDPGNKEYWKKLVMDAKRALVGFLKQKPQNSDASNLVGAFEYLGQRLENPEGASPKEMNQVRLQIQNFLSLFEGRENFDNMASKTFAQQDPGKAKAAYQAVEELSNLLDIAANTKEWKGPNFEKSVAYLERYLRNFNQAMEQLK